MCLTVQVNLLVESEVKVKAMFVTNIYCYFSIFIDHTALLWSIETGKCLVKYVGHVGSGKMGACCENWKQWFWEGEVPFIHLQKSLLWFDFVVCQYH